MQRRGKQEKKEDLNISQVNLSYLVEYKDKEACH